MTTAFSKLTIKKPYLVLPISEWSDVPNLTVLMGTNGSGKSKILQLIKLAVDDVRNEYATLSLSKSKIQCQVLRITDFGGGIQGANLASLQQKASELQNYLHRPQYVPEDQKKIYEKLLEDMRTKHGKTNDEIKALAHDDLQSFIPADHQRYWDPRIVVTNADISDIFFRYHELYLNTLSRISQEGNVGSDLKTKVVTEIGEAPWDTLNNLFEKYNLNHRFLAPVKLSNNYVAALKDVTTGARVEFANLSSGESILTSLLLWVYREKFKDAVDLLLLDEPDAQLHPSMIRMFIDVVDNILVRQYGIQVILTTHNPATVALAPDESLRIIERYKGIKKISKREAISALSENLFIIQDNIKVVLVEGPTDVPIYEEFYQAIKTNKLVQLRSELYFKPVATSKTPGGRKAVIDWLKKLTDIGWVISGIIDHDNDPYVPEVDNVVQLNRYSIENYIYDPVLLLAYLVNTGNNYGLSFVPNLLKGQAHKLPDQATGEANKFLAALCSDLFPDQTQEFEEISYGKNKYSYPRPFLITEGKILAVQYEKKFPGFKQAAPQLMHTMNWVPKDLLSIFQQL